MIKNKEGVITIKIVIILSSLIFLFTVLFDILIIQYSKNTVLRDQELQLDSILSNYSTYLFVNYGLYGVSNLDFEIKKISSTLINMEDYNLIISGVDSLDNSSEVKNQILEFMKIRLPINYLDQLVNKFDIINKSKESKDLLDLKWMADKVISSVEDCLNSKISKSYEANKFTLNIINNIIDTCNLFNEDYIQLKKKYENINTKSKEYEVILNKLLVMYEIEKSKKNNKLILDSLYNQILNINGKIKGNENNNQKLVEKIDLWYLKLNEITIKLDSYINVNHQLINAIKLLDETSFEASILIDSTIKSAEENKGVNEIFEFVVDDLNISKLRLKEFLNEEELNLNKTLDIGSDSENSIVIAAEINIFVLNELKNSINIYSKKKFKNNFFDFDKIINTTSISNLKYYFNYFDDSKIVKNLEKKYDDYYKTQKKNIEKKYDDLENKEYRKINSKRKLNSESNLVGTFWNAANIILNKGEDLYNNISINEYILSTFLAVSQPSVSDYDFFDKYNREHFFYTSEVEYILCGSRYEGKNAIKVGSIIFSVRTVMNGLHIYTDTEKMTLSETIGMAVAGWTGLGGPLASNIVRISWAISESVIDMKDLYLGEGVPFYKIYSDQWKLDFGIVVEKAKKIPSIKLIEFTYHDYLRFMLLTVNEDIKVSRIMDLISLNLDLTKFDSDLSLYLTKFKIKSKAVGKSFFLDKSEFQKIDFTKEKSY